jgi:mono/diheme cytochrome c family protein
MRTLLKWAGRILGGLILVLGVAAFAVYFASNAKLQQRYPVTVQPAALPADAQAAMRGRHVAVTRGCLDCHGADGGGAKVIDNPAMGKMYGPNVTHGRGGLKADFGNEGWVRAIRHGIGADGHSLVLMPSKEYSEMSEDDLGSLIVFMQSLPAVDRESVPVRLGPVARALLVAGKFSLAAAVIDHEKVAPSQVPPGSIPNTAATSRWAASAVTTRAIRAGKLTLGLRIGRPRAI